MSRRKEFYAGKNPPRSGKKALSAVITVVAIAALGVSAFLGVRYLRERQAENLSQRSPSYCEYTWETDNLKNAGDFKFFVGGLAVYTDRETGLQGLAALDGTRLTEAEYSGFAVVYNGWRSASYIAYPEGEAYPKLVRVAEKIVDKKQYQGGNKIETRACWDKATQAVAWFDELGYAGEILPEELALAEGLYPISDSAKDAAKYGYINQNLALIVEPSYEMALDFSDGAGAVLSGGLWGYIDSEGTALTKPRFSSVGDLCVEEGESCFGFRRGLAPVRENGMMGIIDKSGKTVVDFDFEAILQGENGSFIAKKDGKWGVITLAAVPESETETYTNAPQGDPAIGKGDYVVSTSGNPLRLRSTTSTDSEVLEKIPNGTRLKVTKSVSGWAYVTYNSVSGWVSSEFLTPA